MKNMTHRMTAVLAALLGLAGGSSPAQDLAPPWRGQPGSAYQEWRFDTSANPAPPELSTSPTTSAKAEIRPGQFSIGWLQQSPGLGADKSGLWDLGRNGTIAMTLSNLSGSAYQRVSVQVSQWLDGGIYNELANVSVVGGIIASVDTGLASLDTVGGWYVDQTEWLVPDGATVDRILVTGAHNGSVIDRVSVDTLSSVTTPVLLTIQRLAGGTNLVEVSWSSPTDGYLLEGTSDLSDSQSWRPVEVPVQVSGDRHSVPVEAGDSARFFRLKQR